MSVHAGAERNVCIIKVSAETPQTTTNPSQTLLPMYKLANLPLSHLKRLPQPLAQPFVLQMQVSGIVHWSNRLEVCLYNLSVSKCEFVTMNPISLRIFKVSPELSLLAHTKYGCR